MKKILSLCVVVVLCFGVLGGCAHEHTWVDASCFSPKTCTSCGETEGDVRGHIWIDATCTEPKSCSACGEKEGTASGHSWTKGTATTPKECTKCGEMEPIALPKSGTVFLGKNLNRASKLTIHSSSSDSCYVKLKGSTGKNVFSFFVRAGESVTVDVPGGYYYVYFSYGKDWYGTDRLFGEETTYSKDDELCDFKNYTWEYTLYPSYNGNFSETPIDADEFR